MKKLLLLLMILGVAALPPSLAHARALTILDFEGFVYESDNTPGAVGFPPSNPGDVLAGCGLITGMSAPLTWSTDDYQYTWVLSDLVSIGEYDLGNGVILIDYAGGALDIYADAFAGPGYTAPVHGIEPPNATAPSTFADGNLYLHGVFSSFTMFYFPSLSTGQYEGMLTFQLGSNLGELENPAGYTFAGTVDPSGAITIPTGYDLEAVGHIDFDPAIPTEPSTWGEVKNLYR